MIPEFQGEHRWLSNFWPAEVTLDGQTYPSVEHAYQAAKTDNPGLRNLVRRSTASGAKRTMKGHGAPNDWDQRRVLVMWDLLKQKFAHEDLRELLLATGDAVLQEGNLWYDTYWGVDLRTNEGHNVLGKLLMELRKRISMQQKGA